MIEMKSCKSLQSVLFESGSRLNTIGSGAFSRCPALERINIPASVTVLESRCFAGLDHNGRVVIVNNSLVSVTFESGSQLRSIGKSAFAGCVSLVSICIPASVVILENNCFGGVFAEDPEENNRDRDFRFCISLESITFEKISEIKVIDEQAFTGCVSLRSICIPASVEVIGNNCFGLTDSDESYRCKSLEFVIIESGSMLREVGSNVFKGCDSLPRVEVFPDFAANQRSLFGDEDRRLWVREIENGWSFLRRFDDYYLLEEAPREIDEIPARSKLMSLSDSFFCRCIGCSTQP
jgi:hypothetical protein